MKDKNGLNPKNIKRMANKYNVDLSKIDIKAKWDSKLSQKENYKKIRKEIKKHADTEDKLQNFYQEMDKYLQQQKEHNKEINEKEEKELMKKQRKSIEKIAQNKNTDISKHYNKLREYIKTTINGHSNALIVKSKAGLGKTYQTLQVLEEEGKTLGNDYIYINTYSTPLEFYRTLYQNKDKTIILDDIEGVLTSEKTISMLKSALWSTTDEREIQYRSSKLPNDLPKKYKFKGQIIILCNELKIKGENIEALKNRCLYHELQFTHNEKIEIMSKLAHKNLGKGLSRKEKIKVLKHIQHIVNEAYRLNLRNYIKSLDIYNQAKQKNTNWKQLIEEQLGYEKDDDLETLKEIMKQGYTEIKDEIKKFKEKTGKSRRTYYRYKQRIKERRGDNVPSGTR